MHNALTKFYDKHATQLTQLTQPDSHSGMSKVILTDISRFHPAEQQNPAGLLDMPILDGRKVSNPATCQSVDDYQTGFDAGQAQAETVYNQSIAVMQEALNRLQEAVNAAASQIETGHAAVVQACLEALLPKLADHSLRREMEQIINAGTQGLLCGEITARFHPDNQIACDFLRPIAERKEGQKLALNLQMSGDMDPQSVSFEWSHGGADISPHDVVNACLEPLNTP